MERINLPFTGIPTFLRAPLVADPEQVGADVAVLGAPYDEGSPWRPGARFGPRAIREQSVRFAGFGPAQAQRGLYDVRLGRRRLADVRLVDAGDVDVVHGNPELTFANITRAVRALRRRGVLPVVLGGDHAVSSAVVASIGEPIHVVQLDAHLDYRPVAQGVRYGNGNPMRLIGEMPHVDRIFQVGIRSLRTSESDLQDALKRGNRIITRWEVDALGPEAIAAEVPADRPLYVTVDLDVLDLPLVPGCASAEPDGLSFGQLRDILQALAARHRVVGFDVVELNPMLDVPAGNTALVACQVILEFLGAIFDVTLKGDGGSDEA